MPSRSRRACSRPPTPSWCWPGSASPWRCSSSCCLSAPIRHASCSQNTEGPMSASIAALLPSTPTGPAAPPSIAHSPHKTSGLIRLWPWALAGLVVLGFVGAVTWRILAPEPDVWTNNAYVRVHFAAIAPRVSGQVIAVHVGNNDTVKAGQVLVELDDRDYRAAVASAEATLIRDRAMVENAMASIVRQGPMIEQARAQQKIAEAQLSFAEEEARRYEHLATSGSGTVKAWQNAGSNLLQSQAAVAGAKAAVEAAEAQLKILQTQEAS